MTFFDFGEIIDQDTEYVVFGIPWDYLTSIKAPNSAIAPSKIRDVTKDLALTTELGYRIPKFKVVDIGDVNIVAEEVEKNLKEITKFIQNIYSENKNIIPIMIGGDHFCTFPVMKAVGDIFDKKEELGVLIFDAHLDLYEEWDKGVYSHATVSHRIFDLDYINNKNLVVAGTRDIDIPELEIADKENIFHLDAYRLLEEGLDKCINHIIEYFKYSNIKSLYVSIDIDALDPSIAPGTGFAIPGGYTYREMWKTLREIAKNFNIIGFDLVEVAPNLDIKSNLTCNLAAKLIAEFMSFITNESKRI